MIDYLQKKYNLANIRPLEGGYSFCDKYRTDEYVIKIFDIDHYDGVLARVDFIQTLHNEGLKVPKVIGYGKHEAKCYQILEFIEGKSGQYLEKLSKEVQFRIGVEAGKELKRFHELSENIDNDVYGRFKEKIKRLVREYKEYDIQFEKEKVVLQYLTSHLYLLKGRLAKHLHGDFHPENMAFDVHGYNGVYDFERNKFEDYVRDLERSLYFSRDFSLEYTKGFLEGYDFNEYEVLKVYLAVSIFASFVWSKKYYPDDLEEFRRLSLQVVNDFDDFKKIKPAYME